MDFSSADLVDICECRLCRSDIIGFLSVNAHIFYFEHTSYCFVVGKVIVKPRAFELRRQYVDFYLIQKAVPEDKVIFDFQRVKKIRFYFLDLA